MRNVILICQSLLFCCFLHAQNKVTVKAGPELLTSFNHRETFIGIGGSIEALKLIKERLTLGFNTGFLNFTATKSIPGSYSKTSYSLIPVLLVIHYPLPITPNLYGEDHMGYSFAQNAIYEKTAEKVAGGFTYYFAIGYTIGPYFDISVKVGRSRFDKKDNPANVNEHNLGLKLAYIF
jgi:hypothetical protein